MSVGGKRGEHSRGDGSRGRGHVLRKMKNGYLYRVLWKERDN